MQRFLSCSALTGSYAQTFRLGHMDVWKPLPQFWKVCPVLKYAKRDKTSCLSPFFQIHHDEDNSDDGFACSCQFRHDPPQAEAALCLSELALNRNAIHLILILLPGLFSSCSSILRRRLGGRAPMPDQRSVSHASCKTCGSPSCRNGPRPDNDQTGSGRLAPA